MNGRVRAGVAAASLMLCLAGMGSLVQGVAVPVRAEIAQENLEQVFEQRLASGKAGMTVAAARTPTNHQPFKAAEKVPYRQPVLPQEGPIARLSVERLGVDDIVVAGEPTHDRLALGPTMLKRGDAANAVTILAAHRDTHFLFVRDLNVGDAVTLQIVDGQIRHYRVARMETVRWDQFAYPLDPARPLLVLTTCFPFGGTEYGGPLRRIVWAELVD